MAVSVEDRDQTYNFVDVRDVAVLDPDVGCHSGCLLRGAIDAFQRGWEFSVQVGSGCVVSFHPQGTACRGMTWGGYVLYAYSGMPIPD